MDEKIEDKSEDSKKNHLIYYRSLTKIITDMKNEINDAGEPAIKEHLISRIDAMEKDRKRIRDLFPGIKYEEWDDHSS
jgi:transcription termination factor NusB